MNPVERVEVSLDGGASWNEAAFVGPDLGRFAWRVFALEVDLPASRHVLASQATDATGKRPARGVRGERRRLQP